MFFVEIFDTNTGLFVDKIELPATLKISSIRDVMGGHIGDRSIGTTFPIFEDHRYFFGKYIDNMDFNKYDYYLELNNFKDYGTPMAGAF